jgi:hypothetical protein
LQRYSPIPELALSDCAVNTAEAGSLQSYGQFTEGFYTLDLNEVKLQKRQKVLARAPSTHDPEQKCGASLR